MAICKLPVYVPSDVLEALGAHTGHFWSDRALEPIIADAILASIKPAPPAGQQPATATDPASDVGYQWKQLFLPEGTKLRASFGGQPYFAVVEGAQIKHGAHAVSPSCFANLQGSGNRNAWKAVWLRFPGSVEWLLADTCRAARKAAIARMFDAAEPEVKRPAAPPQAARITPSLDNDARRLLAQGTKASGARGKDAGHGGRRKSRRKHARAKS
jgi:hypothetical protein